MKKQTLFSPVAALILAEVLWGINTPIIKRGLETVPLPVYHSVTILGAALLLAPLARRHWKRMSPKDYMLLSIGSIITISLGNVALLMGLQRVPALNAPLIGLFAPLLLFILAAQFLNERLNLRTFAGILIAFVGAASIIGKPWEISAANQNEIMGNLLLVLSALCNVIGALICKKVLTRGSSPQVTFLNLFIGILPVVIFSVQYIPNLNAASIDTSGFAAMTVSPFALAGANAFYMYGLKAKKAHEVSIFGYIHPLVTALVAWFLLAEVPNQKIVTGGLLIFIGIYLAEARIGGKRKLTVQSAKRATTAKRASA